MLRAQRLHIAVVCGAAHLLLRASIQAVSLGWYVPSPPGWVALAALQTQNAVVSVALAAAAWLLAPGRRARWAILPLAIAADFYCLADQIYYKIFLAHIRSTVTESGSGLNPGLLIATFVHEWDLAFAISAAAALAGLVWVSVTLLRPAVRPRFDQAALGIAAVLAASGIPAISSTRYFGLGEHPLWTAVRDLGRRDLGQVLASRPAASAPAVVGAGERDPRLDRLVAAGRAARRRRNVVLIVLESVGARNLLSPQGGPDPALAPTMASLAARGVLFNNVYTPYPGTARSWMSLHTGGGNLPLGGDREIRAPYDGPTLARVFEKLGYATAFFSGQPLDVESADILVGQMGFQHVYDFARDIARGLPQYSNTIWAAREERTLSQMEPWIEAAAASGRPFLAEYITGATHYPYGVPRGYPAPFPALDPAADYKNALHYTDYAIGRLLAFLESRGLRRDTVVAITGDHGEGFADVHPANRGHRDYLYEENVRAFLLLSDPAAPAGAIVSHRIAGNGAILGTLTSWIDPDGVHEPNLLAPEFAARPVYFYKLVSPEQCGLRDGRWKHIGAIRSGENELYDLSLDPEERVNVASLHPNMVAAYRAQCQAWMVETHREYVSRVRGFQRNGPRELAPTDLRSPGPKLLAIGRLEGGALAMASRFGPRESPGAWTKWVDAVSAPVARYQWIAPGGREYWQQRSTFFTFDEAFSECPAPRPLAPGEWKVRVWIAGKPALSAAFQVSP